jgi:zinc protease
MGSVLLGNSIRENNQMVMVTTLPNGTSAQGFNGAVGWATTPGSQSELKGQELAKIRRAADIARSLKIREESLSPRVVAKVSVGEREAFQISGRADGQRVQLFFDTQTGLLLRRQVMSSTVLGAYPEQTDYDDYREVDGVKLPFITRYSTPDPSAGFTINFKDINHNIPVDDARFNPPSTLK